MKRLDCLELRKIFKNLQGFVLNQSRYDKIVEKNIDFFKEQTINELQKIQNQNDFTYFEELAFYQEKFTDLQRAFSHSKKHQSKEQLQSQIHSIFNCSLPYHEEKALLKQPEVQIKQTNSFMNESHEQEEKKPKSQQKSLNTALHAFFTEKQRGKPELGFKSLLLKEKQESVMKSRGFKKKKNPQKDLQMKKLIEENKRLHSTLQQREKNIQQINEFQKNILKDQKEQCLQRINELEDEIEELSRDNYKLKEIEKSRRATSTIYNETKRQETYVPYVMNTQANDLNKISKKPLKKQADEEVKDLGKGVDFAPKNNFAFDFNFLDKKVERQQPKPKQDNLILEELLNYSEDQPRRIRQKEDDSFKTVKEVKRNNDRSETYTNFESFSLAKTLYNNSSLFLNASKNLVAIDSVTSTRNKVAFFKNSMVIVRQKDFQIAFKKSELDPTMCKIRFIFYIHNKTKHSVQVDFQYDYEPNSFIINVSEKLSFVGASSQAREVLQITYTSEKDLNSVIDSHVTIGNKRYDLWVPVCFVEWTESKLSHPNNFEQLIIQPDRQFGKYESVKKLLPLSKKQERNKDQCSCFLFCRSKFGNDRVRLGWWERELAIEASERIIDLIGFIMHHFK